jgi:(1->4)-alpha-D-glucan 1-alpha-D-glucosylmutase
LYVLSEIPERWAAAVEEWRKLNTEHRTLLSNNPAPDPSDEYFIYQTLLGAWPMQTENPPSDFSGRINAYMQKALREAKRHTTWTDNNQEYESAAARFVDGSLGSRGFVESFRPLVEHCAFFGVFNSLAQVLLKICSPGVPDFYQGTELWDLNLVDPDNRRPVDYKLRKDTLANVLSKIQSGPADFARKLMEAPHSPEIKLFTICTALQFRQSNPALFSEGDYVPLRIKGAKARHVIAFARHFQNRTMIAAVPRFCSELAGGHLHPPTKANLWADTFIETGPSGMLRNVFTDETIKGGALHIRDLFASFPVALLASA